MIDETKEIVDVFYNFQIKLANDKTVISEEFNQAQEFRN